jgi:hypothetical protein
MGAPMVLGAALGGITSAARGGNPLTGALLGGIGGGVFGAASGAAGGAAGAAQAANIAAAPAASMGAINTAAGQAMAAPSLMSTLQQVPKSFMQFSKDNPFTMNMASNLAQEEFKQSPVQNPGLLRGRPAEEQAMPYSSPVPKFSLL